MAVSLAKCPRCDQLFQKIRSLVCPRCQDDEDADHERIRDVLCYEPSLTAEEVAEVAGVERACVLRMLDEGLITSAALADPPACGRCGAPAISPSKRVCQSCLLKLNFEFADAVRRIREQKRKEIEEQAEAFGVRQTFEDKRRT